MLVVKETIVDGSSRKLEFIHYIHPAELLIRDLGEKLLPLYLRPVVVLDEQGVDEALSRAASHHVAAQVGIIPDNIKQTDQYCIENLGIHSLDLPVDICDELGLDAVHQSVYVVIVAVEGASVDVRALTYLTHADLVEVLFFKQFEEGAAYCRFCVCRAPVVRGSSGCRACHENHLRSFLIHINITTNMPD